MTIYLYDTILLICFPFEGLYLKLILIKNISINENILFFMSIIIYVLPLIVLSVLINTKTPIIYIIKNLI